MKKKEFVELVKTTGEYKSNAEAEKAIKAFTEAVKTALKDNKGCSIVGFGAFSTEMQKGRSGKVPGTDKTYTTEDKMYPKFKFSKTLKEEVAGNKLV